MVKVYKGIKWEDYNDPLLKGEIYLIFAHFLKSPEGFSFNGFFKDSYINYLEDLKNKSISNNQYKGYLGQLSKMSFFEHENRDYGQSPDNRLYLNIEGKEFFFLFKNQILSYGKEKKLDLFLHPIVRKYIPEIYLNIPLELINTNAK